MVGDLLARLTVRPNESAEPGGGAGTSRRTLLGRGLAVAAGAVGAAVAGSSTLTNQRPAAASTPVAPVPFAPIPAAANATTFSVFVRDIRFTAPGVKPGSVPEAGSFKSPHGQLSDLGGGSLGALSGGVLPGSLGQISVHRFTLNDGTLVGMGSGSLDDEEYAIVGGTGRYAGVSGWYRTKLTSGDFGRDAEFVMSVTGARE